MLHHFLTALERQVALRRPAHLYGHPEVLGRMAHEVLPPLFDAVARLGLPNMTVADFAAWWIERDRTELALFTSRRRDDRGRNQRRSAGGLCGDRRTRHPRWHGARADAGRLDGPPAQPQGPRRERSPSPRFLCIGDIDVDILIAVDRLPTRDGKVNGEHLQRVPGGMAGNVAVALARLGGAVRILGRVGDDDEAAFALAGLAQAGVDTAHVVRLKGVRTFSCIGLITPDGEKSLVKLMTPAYRPAPPR